MTEQDIYQIVGEAYCVGLSEGINKQASFNKGAYVGIEKAAANMGFIAALSGLGGGLGAGVGAIKGGINGSGVWKGMKRGGLTGVLAGLGAGLGSCGAVDGAFKLTKGLEGEYSDAAEKLTLALAAAGGLGGGGIGAILGSKINNLIDRSSI